MKISIVIPTLGRRIEVKELLASMIEVKDYEHEIIIVDQNFNKSLDNIVKEHLKHLDIIHAKVDFRSLSKAKNYGIKMASGEIICFPDDDSRFFKGTLINAIKFLNENISIDIVFGKCIDDKGIDSVIKFYSNKSELTLKNFEGKFIEATMFARTSILKNNYFDENMGIGSFFGAEEGYDLIYRLLKQNYTLYYDPEIKFYHPQTINDYSNLKALRRVFEYRKGFAYLCRKHKLRKKFFIRLFFVFAAIFGLAFIDYKRARYYVIELFSLSVGYIFSKYHG